MEICNIISVPFDGNIDQTLVTTVVGEDRAIVAKRADEIFLDTVCSLSEFIRDESQAVMDLLNEDWVDCVTHVVFRQWPQVERTEVLVENYKKS